MVFARSSDAALGALNMGAMMSQACATLGGKGGGKPEMAQGGGPSADQLEQVIEQAVQKVKQG